MKRYKVIADYPDSPFKAGGILTERNDLFVFPALCDDDSNQPNWIGLGEAEKYPHLFKELQWWEDKTINEYPKYLRHKNGKVSKIERYAHGWAFADGKGYAITRALQPATLEEYNAYISNPSKQ